MLLDNDVLHRMSNPGKNDGQLILVNDGILIFSMLHDSRNLINTLLKEKNSRGKIFVKYVFDKTQYKDVLTLKKMDRALKQLNI